PVVCALMCPAAWRFSGGKPKPSGRPIGLNIAKLSFGATAARHDGEAIVNHPRSLETAVARVLYTVRCVVCCDAPDTVGWRAYPYSCSPGKIRTRAVTYADGPERVRRP